MIAERLRRIRPVHLVAFAALLLAVGGTAYAGAKIGSKDVRNESLRGVDVKNGSLGGGELSRNAVGARELDGSDDTTVGALILVTQGEVIDVVNPDGITAAERTSEGNYALTLTEGYVGCNFATTFTGDGDGTAPATAAISGAEDDQITVTISNASGIATDIEDIDGLFGFQIVGACV
ncbi:hypothetical protein HJD18_09075 [Thermoleophilia bacterium SCSIO 60948]|nr:hypothetical protein HJD18_09075 [Thermoleophilia bacterium SCSIO 60948]